MARPKKKTVDYFPHYCSHKKTIFILEQRYGNNGYAFWFKLLEILGSTENHWVDYGDGNISNWEFLQAKTHLSSDICNEMLNLLANLGAIDKDLWTQRIIWSQNFVDGIADVYRNRRIEIPSKPDFYKQKAMAIDISTDKSTQSKVKESKVKESKVNIPSKHEYGEYKNVLLTDDEFQRLQKDYPVDINGIIEFLSNRFAMKKYNYKSHYLVIRDWGAKGYFEKKKKDEPYPNPWEGLDDAPRV